MSRPMGLRFSGHFWHEGMIAGTGPDTPKMPLPGELTCKCCRCVVKAARRSAVLPNLWGDDDRRWTIASDLQAPDLLRKSPFDTELRSPIRRAFPATAS